MSECVCKYVRNLNFNCSLEICARKEHMAIWFLSVALPHRLPALHKVNQTKRTIFLKALREDFGSYQFSASCILGV